MAEVAAVLMRSREAALCNGHLLVEEPGAIASTPWHQDQPYFRFTGRQSCSIWIALDQVTAETSAKKFAAGSHRWSKWFDPTSFWEGREMSIEFDGVAPDPDRYPGQTKLSHVGFHVFDLARMEDFYVRVMGFAVSDRAPVRGLQGMFLTRDPADHHQIVLFEGHTAPRDAVFVNQITFQVNDLEEVSRQSVSRWAQQLAAVDGAIKSEEIIEFLAALERQTRHKLLIVWDGVGAHKSRRVREWLEQQNGPIAITYLPPYAPELNPVEAIWAYLKKHEIANLCPTHLPEVSEFARRRLKSMQRRPKLVRAFWQQADLAL